MSPTTKTLPLLAAAVLVLTCGAGRAWASTTDMVKVRVPFPFVVHNRTLPAGQYMVEREDGSPAMLLIRETSKPYAAAFVITNGAAGHDPQGDKPCLTFTRVENQYRLSSIWESRTEGRTVAEKK